MSPGWVADTHVHLYPDHDMAALLQGAAVRLRALAVHAADQPVLCLTERAGDRVFAGWADGSASPPTGWSVRMDVPGRAWCDGPGGAAVLVVAGRQCLTDDRLEVLCLGVDACIEDGLALSDAVHRVREAGGLPVVPWSPGKWTGSRGKRILDLVARSEPGEICLGDIAMRPRGWPAPAALRAARERGLGILPGSDPLPMAGEERLAGTYGIRVTGDDPIAALRAAPAGGTLVGRRQALPAAALRWLRNQLRGRLR